MFPLVSACGSRSDTPSSTRAHKETVNRPLFARRHGDIVCGMQVPTQFQYEKAKSVEHALSLLARYGPESRVVAGGHSLIPMMKLRLAQPQALIDINDLTELAPIGIDGNTLTIGAMVRHADLLASAVAGEHFPIF